LAIWSFSAIAPRRVWQIDGFRGVLFRLGDGRHQHAGGRQVGGQVSQFTRAVKD